jgi:leucyl-tRNA synthetase
MNNNSQNKQKEIQNKYESAHQNTQSLEKKWQHIWKTQKVFEPNPNSKEKFFATVPYPYGNSALHIGHGRSFTTADIIARYQRLLGKNVLYPMAFHISGTPVLAVADGIAKGDAKQIKLTREAIAEYVSDEVEIERLLTSFSDPMEIAKFFSSKIEETFDAIGLSIDWTRQFTTGDDAYKKFIQWQYLKLEEQGVLVQGKYPILYSPVDQNAVGEDDIKDGDVDKVAVQEMKYICFEIHKQDTQTQQTASSEFLVAATLRPDSLFGATNLYIKPDMKLVKLNVNGQIWIVSKQAQVKIENQFDNVQKISEHIGAEFIKPELSVQVPIINKQVPIYPMEYPDENHGTGIVYSSPADSPHDYIYLFELKFPNKSLSEFDTDPLNLTPITQTKDKKGNEITYKSNIPAFDKLHKFKIYNTKGNETKLEEAKEELYKEAHYGAIMINSGEFNNTPLKNNVGANKVKIKLEELQLGGTFYETTRRAYTRNNNQVIVANLNGQWFLDYSDEAVKEKAYTLLDSMTYAPENLKQTQRGYLSWVQKRPCARKRGLGTPLPQDPKWIIEPLSDSTIYQMYYLVANYVYTGKLNEENLTPAFFDYIFLGNGTIAQFGDDQIQAIIQTIRSDVLYWKSFDLRYTAGPHMSNHLSFLIYHYALLFPKEPINLQPQNITIGGLLIKDGEKISKSKGNGIPLIQVPQQFGADLFRLYVATAASYDAEMDFREQEIFQLQKRLAKWYEYMQECATILYTDNQKQKSEKVHKYNTMHDIVGVNSFTSTDAWLLNRFKSHLTKYLANMNVQKLREAYIGILFEFLNDIAYHERRTSHENTINVLTYVFREYVLSMTPVVPHMCEELYQIASISSIKQNEKAIGEKTFAQKTIFASTDSLDNYVQDLCNNKGVFSSEFNLLKSAASNEQIVHHAITEIPGIIANRLKEAPKKITIFLAGKERYLLFADLTKMLSETRDFKTILSKMSAEYPTQNKFIQKFVPKTLSDGVQDFQPQHEEKEFITQAKSFLETEFKCIVEVSIDTECKTAAIPGSPSYIVE